MARTFLTEIIVRNGSVTIVDHKVAEGGGFPFSRVRTVPTAASTPRRLSGDKPVIIEGEYVVIE